MVTSPATVARLFADLARRDRETLCVGCLDTRNRLIDRRTVFVGTSDIVSMHPREILRTAFLTMATRIVVVHHHLSGIPTPSMDEIATMEQLEKACRIVGIELLDHVIIGQDGRFWSWANEERPRWLSETASRSIGPIAAEDRG